MRRIIGLGMAAAMVIGLAAAAGAQDQPPPARAQGMGRGMGMGMGQGPGGMGRGGAMAALKLTADQREKLQAIMQSHREARQATMEQVRALRKQLKDALYGETANEATAISLATKIATLEATERVQAQLAMRAILTPEQIETLRTSGLEFPPMGMGPGAMRGGPGMRGPRK
jgi:Spy/CpxP family protein refolding chaperone